MITIKKSKTADTRSCDFTKVTKGQLLDSSYQHIQDVARGMYFFVELMEEARRNHDFDKISDIDGFHKDFLTGFKEHTWWDKHKKITRHHLLEAVGVPENVNLIDVMEMIVDCVMAGMGRTGTVYPLNIDPEVLKRAFDNTANLLKEQIVVED